MSDHRPRMKPGFYARSMRFGALGVSTSGSAQKIWADLGSGLAIPSGYPNPPSDFTGSPRVFTPFSPVSNLGRLFLECTSTSGTLRETILQAGVARYADLGGLVFSWDPAFRSYNGFWQYEPPDGAVGLLQVLNQSQESGGLVTYVPDADTNATPQGRYWKETWEDKWGPYTNTTTLHRYQFTCSIGLSSRTDTLAAPSGYRTNGYRRRMAWFDSDNGIKLLAMETATKFILHAAVNLWERTRQWETFASTGKPSILRTGEPATEYLADYLWPGNFPSWTAGTFPASAAKTFLDNFRTAYLANDWTTVGTLATQALQGSVGVSLPRQAIPYQSRYHLHRTRFPCPQPTYAPSPSNRDIGTSKLPVFPFPEENQIHTQNYPEDRVVTYPNVGNSELVERDFETPNFVQDVAVRGNLSASGQHENTALGSEVTQEQEQGTGFPHPTIPVEATTATQNMSPSRSRIYTRTAAAAMTASPMPNVVRWIQEGSSRVISGTANYEAVAYRARLSKTLGSTGLVGGTINYSFGSYQASGIVVEGFVPQLLPTSADRSFTLEPGGHTIPFSPYTYPTTVKPFIYRKPKATGGSRQIPSGIVFVRVISSAFALTIFEGWSGTFDFQYKIPGINALSEPITITVTVPPP